METQLQTLIDASNESSARNSRPIPPPPPEQPPV